MLKQSSDDEINGWLIYLSQHLSYPLYRLTYNHWQFIFTNPIATYTIDIKDHGDCLSFGTSLGYDVEGPGRVIFYKYLLNLNAQLNYVHVGIEDGRIILSGEFVKDNLAFSTLGQCIYIFDNAFQAIYQPILEEIKRLGLRRKQ